MTFNVGNSLNAMMNVKKCAFCSTQSSHEQKSTNDTQNTTNNSSSEEECEEHKKLFPKHEEFASSVNIYFNHALNLHVLLNNYYIFQEIPTPPPIL